SQSFFFSSLRILQGKYPKIGRYQLPALVDENESPSMSQRTREIHLGSPTALSGSASENVNKKHAETVNILMNYMSKTAFKAVVTPDNEERSSMAEVHEIRVPRIPERFHCQYA
ncbi:hypothetical protein VP01_11046g1, partial [Puccinia sorghi]